ncbi:MAG TPA: glycosyltransferase family 39 protein, partial [Methylomirabilota bacterium]|nr:glycosyltransferase family 39 protein [Methylomirabilota bacterium]
MPRGPAALLHGLERVSPTRAAWGVTLLGAVARVLYFPVPAISGSDCDAVAYMEVARHLRAGHGFVTNTLYHLWVTPAAFPRPESLWNPLQPYAIATLGAVVPDLWLAAKLVALLFGLCVPALTLFVTERFTGRRDIACIAGLLAALDPTLVTWSARPLTEMGTIALVTLVWVLAFRRGRGAGWLLGVAAGLACLQKYQSGLVWLGLVPAVIADRGGREGARTLATAAIGFALVMAPWWVRNLLAFGDPFYTEIKWNLLCDWGLGGDELRFWARFERPPTLPGYALTHPIDALRVTYGGLRVLLDIGWRDTCAPGTASSPTASITSGSRRRRSRGRSR